MDYRNRRARRRQSGSGMQDMLRSILRAASDNFAGTSVFDDDFDRPQPPTLPLRILQWQEALIELREQFPEEEAFEDNKQYMNFRLTGVYSDGLVTAECDVSPFATRLFLHPEKSPPAGCNCIQSRGEYPCVHTYKFIGFLLSQFQYPTSEFRRRLADGRFDSQRPPADAFKFDSHAHVSRLLDSYLPAVARLVSPPADLPDINQPGTLDRVAWNFSLSGDALLVHPILQARRKRGDGWTKGKKIALQRIRDHAGNLSDADRAVTDLIEINHQTYYGPNYQLNAGAALECLVGQPNVFWEDTPATVDHFSPYVRYFSDDRDCWFDLDFGDDVERTVLHADQLIIAIDTENAAMSVTRMEPRQVDCIRRLMSMPNLPKEAENELLERARNLQEVVSLKLPESLAGKFQEDSCTPALLLRSRADGTLDYGLRVRDAFGHLHQPAAGLAVRVVEENGQPIQLVRCFDSERRMLRESAGELDLPPDQVHGTISDFEQTIQLLDRAQSLEPELEVLWDKSSEKPVKVLGTVSSKNVQVGISQRRDWFQLSGTCQFEGRSVEISELLDSFKPDAMRGDYVRIGDHGWAKITETLREQLKRLSDSVSRERGLLKFDATSAPAIRDVLGEDMQLKTTRAWQACLARLRSAEQLEPELPASLNADLRDYQREGFCWLRRLAEWGVGGVLADDMGLGKTLQTLAVLLDRAAAGPALVIAPTSVGFNWVRETEKFTTALKPHLYRETDRADFLTQLQPGDLVVCSYGLALRDADKLASVTWASLVLDEAQAVKNSRSKTSAAIQSIPADWRIALTGTPMENHLGELWSIFRVIAPGVFGGWEQFRKRYAAPIEKNNDEERRAALRDRIRPFVLRRTKKQVLHDLPARTETNVYIEMSQAEKEAYDRVRLSAVGELDLIARLPDIQDQRFRILALLTRLRQLACSPRLVHEDWTERSSKLTHLGETLKELRDEGHRVLVFSQFVGHLKLIREMLDAEGVSYEYLDGSTPAKARQERVDRFQSGDATVFLISLKAGGTGLNLTAADYVIHMDPWWNPAVEDQATDRAHRIGQDKPVMVYRFVSQNTIEEEILKLHDSKRDLVAGVLEGSSSAAKLSAQDLANLIRGR